MEAKKTPLYNEHISLGGKVVDYAGWFLPVQYEGLVAEHEAVRNAVGVVGMVSLIPVLVIQMLGVTVKYKEYKKALAFKRHIFDVDDNQIIYFDEEED